MNFLAANLKLIRKKRWRLSQERFAELLNSSRSKINSYENGGIEPSIEFMLLLQSFSGLSIRDLVHNEVLLENVPEVPFDLLNKDVFLEDKAKYDSGEEISELITYDQKIKERFKYLEERLSGLEEIIKDKDTD